MLSSNILCAVRQSAKLVSRCLPPGRLNHTVITSDRGGKLPLEPVTDHPAAVVGFGAIPKVVEVVPEAVAQTVGVGNPGDVEDSPLIGARDALTSRGASNGCSQGRKACESGEDNGRGGSGELHSRR